MVIWWKQTEYCFLITGIYLKNENLEEGLKSCITNSVNKSKLILLLKKYDITKAFLKEKDKEIRNSNLEKNTPIINLDSREEECLCFSKQFAESL